MVGLLAGRGHSIGVEPDPREGLGRRVVGAHQRRIWRAIRASTAASCERPLLAGIAREVEQHGLALRRQPGP